MARVLSGEVRDPLSISQKFKVDLPDCASTAIIEPEHVDMSASNQGNDEAEPADLGGIVSYAHHITDFH